MQEVNLITDTMDRILRETDKNVEEFSECDNYVFFVSRIIWGILKTEWLYHYKECTEHIKVDILAYKGYTIRKVDGVNDDYIFFGKEYLIRKEKEEKRMELTLFERGLAIICLLILLGIATWICLKKEKD